MWSWDICLTVITQGTWSKVSFARVSYCTRELWWPNVRGETTTHFSRRGWRCILDQVYTWPFTRISWTPSWLMAMLMSNILCILALGLLQFLGLLIILKSPNMIQGLSRGIMMLENNWRNSSLSSFMHGAYMFVSHHFWCDSLEQKWTVWAKLFCCTIDTSNFELFQMLNMQRCCLTKTIEMLYSINYKDDVSKDWSATEMLSSRQQQRWCPSTVLSSKHCTDVVLYKL